MGDLIYSTMPGYDV